MPYKSYTQQVAEHLEFLRAKGFNINSLVINPVGAETRCRDWDETQGRGELAYRSTSKRLENGLLGIGTWCRGHSGEEDRFLTYGLWPNGDDAKIEAQPAVRTQISETRMAYPHQEARKAYGFWSHSALKGKSDYLDMKGVGYYGIRFRAEKYGNVAVIPMRDSSFHLWSYQLLNPDGTKRFAKGVKTIGLRHDLGKLVETKPIGIAESYVTAATCMELTKIPTVCAFSADNLRYVSQAIRKLFPKSHIHIFADNDCHLTKNKGVQIAKDICSVLKREVSMVVPEFGGVFPSQSSTDWNDLVRIIGFDEAKRQIFKLIRGG